MQELTYTIHLEPAEEGGYVVFVPALPGCYTQGDTYEEAIENAREAVIGHLEALRKEGEEIPEEKNPIHTSVRVNLDDTSIPTAS